MQNPLQMKGSELKIIFKDDMAFLTHEVALDFEQVEVSDGIVKVKRPSFWKIRVINYIEREKKIFAEILDYCSGETEFSIKQFQLADILMRIEKVTFRSISTPGLYSTFDITFKKLDTVHWQPQSSVKITREPTRKVYMEPFSIPIKDIKFISGAVSFEKKIQQFQRSVKFQIPNKHIIEAYDAVKNYFANVLGTKKILVNPVITTVDGVVDWVSAKSAEIEQIDNALIEEVKFELLSAARRKEVPDDKLLFTTQEYLETITDNKIRPQELFEDEESLLENLLERSGTRHYHHLRFLSSKHKSQLEKLRLIHRPFSFLFIIDGINNFHFIWETLDTEEATYIWRFNRNIITVKDALINIERTINGIVQSGKSEYISRHEENFCKVLHDYTDQQAGFKKWKTEIEKIIR